MPSVLSIIACIEPDPTTSASRSVNALPREGCYLCPHLLAVAAGHIHFLNFFPDQVRQDLLPLVDIEKTVLHLEKLDQVLLHLTSLRFSTI
ncbi:MAG: hypothetical protein WDO14_16640 [Bacteroidota bacterium]